MNAAARTSSRSPNLGGGKVGLRHGARGRVLDDAVPLLEGSAAALASELDLYADVPHFELDMDEFEELALARLKVLRKIEELKSRNVTGDNYRAALDKSVKTNLVADPNSLPSTSASASPVGTGAAAAARKKIELRKRTRRIDTASHFILRAAYCRTEDLRRWFLQQECALFSHRLEKVLRSGREGAAALRGFLRKSGMDFDTVDERDKAALSSRLMSVVNGGGNPPTPAEFAAEAYYRVPFTQALDLVSKRQCYVKAGHAYVPLSRIVSIVRARFRSALSKSLVLAGGAFGTVAAESERIAPLLKSMNSQYTGKDYGDGAGAALGDGGELTAATIEDYVPHMPLCMSQLHSGLTRDHKLRHNARLQYYLFLKGAGLSMDESVAFFSREFTKIMSLEKWTKEYSYTIRHLYGQEGARKSRTPYGCPKIIMGQPPASGEHHGCPYRHYDAENLSSLLTKLEIGTPSDRNVMLKHVHEHNYQLACAKHFEVAHPGAVSAEGVNLEGVGNHPNAWFMASVSYGRAKSGTGGGNEGSKGAVKVEAEEGGSSSSE